MLLNNGLIFQMAKEDQARMQSLCTAVALQAGQVLNPAERKTSPKVYFLTGACVALLAEDDTHHRLAVGLVGSEGAVGLGAVLESACPDLRLQVQTSGRAWMAESAEVTRLLHQRPGMLWGISEYLWTLASHVANTTASVQFDDITCRLAHWLVLSADRAQTHRLHLTHEHLANMLGVRRVSITLAAGALKARGFIAYQRGRLDVLDRSGLMNLRQSTNLTLA